MRLVLTFVLLLVVAALSGPARAQAPDPARAFAQAMALSDAGQPSAALPLLDALVSQDPRNPAYRLALARVLLATGQRDRARFHLSQARGAPGLSAEERAQLDQILQRIDGGKSHEAWVRLAIVPESNPGQRMDGDSIMIGGLEFKLRPGGPSPAATGLHIAFGGALLPRIGNTGLRLRIGGAVDARLFERSALNDVILRGELGVQGITAGGGTWGITAFALDRTTGGVTYGRAIGLRTDWTRSFGQSTQLRLRAEVERWRHPVLTAQDGVRRGLSLSVAHAPRPDLLLRGVLFAQDAGARTPWNAGRSTGVSVGVQKLFAGGLVLGLDVTHVRSRRDGADPLFGVVRQDHRTSLTARVMHRAVNLRGFAPVLELGMDRQSSSIALHSYRNARVSFGLSREF
jgi:outer membrane protein